MGKSLAELSARFRLTTVRAVIGSVFGLILLLSLANLLSGYGQETDYSVPISNGVFPDVIHERASAWEALWGDPHRPTGDILSDQGYEAESSLFAPRPPSAMILQTPLVLIPEDLLMPIVMTTVLGVLVLIGWLSHRISGIEIWKLLWAAPLIVISMPVVTALSYSPIFGLISVALVLSAWAYPDSRWSGLLLGVAISMRLWPGLVAVGFWISGKRRLAYESLTIFVIVTVAGIALPRVTLEGAVASLIQGGEGWVAHTHNASLAAVLWRFGVPPLLVTAIISLLVIWLALRHRTLAVPVTILGALIASPLSWTTYALAVLPIALICARFGMHIPVLVLAIGSALWGALPREWLGHTHLIILIVLLLMVLRLANSPDLSQREPSLSVPA